MKGWGACLRGTAKGFVLGILFPLFSHYLHSIPVIDASCRTLYTMCWQPRYRGLIVADKRSHWDKIPPFLIATYPLPIHCDLKTLTNLTPGR